MKQAVDAGLFTFFFCKIGLAQSRTACKARNIQKLTRVQCAAEPCPLQCRPDIFRAGKGWASPQCHKTCGIRSLLQPAADLLGVAPADCVVVEDSAVGVAAGAAAGMRVIALDRANALPQDFRGQTWKVRDLSAFDIEKEFGA